MRLLSRAKGLRGIKPPKGTPAKNWYLRDYLQSEKWRSIRRRVLDRDELCRMCGSVATTVHHLSYSPRVLDGLDDAQLVSLCADCHRHIEFDGERKLTLSEANARLKQGSGALRHS